MAFKAATLMDTISKKVLGVATNVIVLKKH